MATRRAFLGVLGAGVMGARIIDTPSQAGQAESGRGPTPGAEGRGQQDVPVRMVKTTPLFKSPEGYPNAIAVAPDGLWIAEQKTDNAHLVDWNGKVLKTVKTESKNTSGMGFGDGCIWMGANAAPQGIFQTDMSSKTISPSPDSAGAA